MAARMGIFMPSEIARLVLGYLRETGCVRTAVLYLSESPHLIEYAECLKRGYEYPTTIGGQSLIDIFCKLSTMRVNPAATDMTIVLERIDCGVAQLKSLLAKGKVGIEDERSDSEDSVRRNLHRLSTTPHASWVSMADALPPSSEPRDLIRSSVTPHFSASTSAFPSSPVQPVDLSKTSGTVIWPIQTPVVANRRRTDVSPRLTVSRSTSPLSSSRLEDASPVAVAPRSLISTATSPTLPPLQPKVASPSVIPPPSLDTVPSPSALPSALENQVEIVSNDVPTIRIEESPSPGSHGRCVVSVEKDGRSSHQLLNAPQSPTRDLRIGQQTTPPNRPLDTYSSAASIARSALIFSFGIEALQTPVKESDDGNWKSPRRKNQLPRKRLTYTPSSAKRTVQAARESDPNAVPTTSTDAVSSEDCVDISELIGQLLSNTALQERIADNINRVVCSTSDDTHCVTSAASVSRPVMPVKPTEVAVVTPSEMRTEVASASLATEPCVPDNVVKDIIDRTESDPLFEAFINIFFDKHDVNPHDSEQSGTPHSESHSTPMSQYMDSDQTSVSSTPHGGLSRNVNPSKTVNSTVPMTTVSQSSPMLLKTPTASYKQAPSITNLRTPVNVPSPIQTVVASPDPSAMPHIVINDLHLESSLVTEMMTRRMTFTVLEPPTQTLNLAELQDAPRRKQFTTLSPSQLLALNNGQPLTRSSPPKLLSPVKSKQVLPNKDAVEMALQANNKRPKLRCKKFNRKQTATSVTNQSKNGENHEQFQPTPVGTCVRKANRKVCAVRLDFKNSSATGIEVNSTTDDCTEKQSPQLRSLLVQSDNVLNRRDVTTSSDANHVRVLNFGNLLEVGSHVTVPTTPVSNEDASSSTGDARTLDKSVSAASAAAKRPKFHGSGGPVARQRSLLKAKEVPTALTAPSSEPNNRIVSNKRLRILENVKRNLPNDESKGAECKRSKPELASNVLSSMDVDKFLSTVQYVE